MAKRKNTISPFNEKTNPHGVKIQKRRPWWQWLLIGFGGLLAFSIVGQAVGILPDAAERAATQTATALVAQATRQQRTAVAALTAAAIPSETPTPTRTRPSRATAQIEATERDVESSALRILFVAGNANLRSCARTTAACTVVGRLAAGYELAITGEVQGEAVSNSTIWYTFDYQGQQVFIHSSLVTDRKPSAQPPTSRPATNNSANIQPAPTNPPAVEQPTTPPLVAATSTPMPQVQSQFVCGGDLYNCGDFSNRTELMEYFNRCPGDPSRLDQNNDGVPCESLR